MTNQLLRLEQAQEFLDAGKPREALRLLSRRLPAAFSLEQDFLTAESWRALGYFGRCEKLYQKVIGRGPKGNPDLWLESSLSLAAVKRSLGEVAAARRLIQNAQRFARQAKISAFAQRLDLENTLIDRAEGLYARSLKRLAKFLAAFKREQDWSAASFILWAMGGARRFSGDLKGAHQDFIAALKAGKRGRDQTAMAYAVLGLGGATRIQGRLQDSRRYYSQAAQMLSRTQDVFGQAYAQCGLANSLRQLGDYSNAEACYRRAHKLYSQLGDGVDLAYVDWGLGQVALHQGNLSRAFDDLNKALKAFAKGGEARGIVLSEVTLAAVLHAQGHTAKAEALFDQSVKRSRKAGLHAHLESFT